MSHAAPWKCQNEACPMILGEVRNDVLDLFAPRPQVGNGKLAVACPSCGHVRVWDLAEPCTLVSNG